MLSKRQGREELIENISYFLLSEGGHKDKPGRVAAWSHTEPPQRRHHNQTKKPDNSNEHLLSLFVLFKILAFLTLFLIIETIIFSSTYLIVKS